MNFERLIRHPSTTVQLKDLRIFPDSLEIETEPGRRIKLRKKEFQLLYFLINNPNKVINKHALLELIWNYDLYTQTNTLEVHMSNLRKKLHSLVEHPMIQTVHGAGYRLVLAG